MSEQAVLASQFGACIPALQRFARKLTRDADRADDLVQDCIERCLRKQHLFDGGNLRSWMFTVCRRVFLNEIRREKSRGVAVAVEDAPPSMLAVKALQEDTMHYQDVVESFRSLPHNDRVVLALIAIEGLKYDEAAELLQVPIGTIRSRLSRARLRLREKLDAKPEAASAGVTLENRTAMGTKIAASV